jgi:hypothetical protein
MDAWTGRRRSKCNAADGMEQYARCNVTRNANTARQILEAEDGGARGLAGGVNGGQAGHIC